MIIFNYFFKLMSMFCLKEFLIHSKNWAVVLYSFFVMFSLLVLTTLVIGDGNSLRNPNVSYLNNQSIIETFIGGIVLAPILETAIFQALIFWLLGRLISNDKYFLYTYLFCSSIFFALTHYYTIAYFFYTIGCGGVLSYSYFIFKEKKTNAFLFTALIHSIFNFVLLGIGTFIANN